MGSKKSSSALCLTLAVDAVRWSTLSLGRFTPWKVTLNPLYKRLGGPQGRPGRVRKISRTRIRSPDGPANSESLYRLSELRRPAWESSKLWWTRWRTLNIHKMWNYSWLTEEIADSYRGVCYSYSNITISLRSTCKWLPFKCHTNKRLSGNGIKNILCEYAPICITQHVSLTLMWVDDLRRFNLFPILSDYDVRHLCLRLAFAVVRKLTNWFDFTPLLTT